MAIHFILKNIRNLILLQQLQMVFILLEVVRDQKIFPILFHRQELLLHESLASLQKARLHVEVTTACVNEDICCGCQTCIKVCPYTAISFNEEKKVSFVNEILCKGCGTCGSACPTGAIKAGILPISKYFTNRRINVNVIIIRITGGIKYGI